GVEDKLIAINTDLVFYGPASRIKGAANTVKRRLSPLTRRRRYWVKWPVEFAITPCALPVPRASGLKGNGIELCLGAQASSPAGFSRRAVSASKQARTPALPGMATFLIQCHWPEGRAKTPAERGVGAAGQKKTGGRNPGHPEFQ